MNNYEEMRIESDVFATARENFDLLMQRLFDPDYEENLKAGADLDESTMLPGPSNALPEDNGVIDAEFKEVDQSEEAENQADTQANEEITDQEETNAPGGDTEATDSTDDNGDYEYEDPEEGMPE